jgi:hypothetical protein
MRCGGASFIRKILITQFHYIPKNLMMRMAKPIVPEFVHRQGRNSRFANVTTTTSWSISTSKIITLKTRNRKARVREALIRLTFGVETWT